MSNQIIFIHGMFLNPKCWEHWIHYFEKRDFSCSAPAWPLHDGEPRALRSHVPEGLGQLKLQDVVDRYRAEIRALDERPILIGHEMGGLVAQMLAAQDLATMAVCIATVPPTELVGADWGIGKNVMTITNPLVGQTPDEMTPERFHDNLSNTLSHAEALDAFDEYVVPESRQVPRDSLRKLPHFNSEQPHAPLLFLAGAKDLLVPPDIVKANAERYRDAGSVSNYHEFPGRSHHLICEPGWQEIAGFAHSWILAQADADASARLDRLSLADFHGDPANAPILRHILPGADDL
ncbi:MAG TPA: alpha/beta fold hydrolase [Opitutaceae bacterium]|jgi:pimeloyl-ACP methyl ester carboxylesterase